jgi:hypothetical protein
MNFNSKYNNFNQKYSYIKNNIKEYARKNVLRIGSGGSDNIIVIDNDIVMKIIPIKTSIKSNTNKDLIEYKYYEELYKYFIKTNKTPHIVGIYKKYNLNITKFLPNKCSNKKHSKNICCPTFDEILLGKKSSYIENQLCSLKYAYDNKIIKKMATCLILEYCPTNISNECLKILVNKNLSNQEKNNDLYTLINRCIFQIIFTLAQIQKTNKKFIHNDLFLRNILAINDTNYTSNDYIEYIFNNISYYLPANGIYTKINDFGYSLNLRNIKSSLLYEIKSSLVINHNYETYNPKRDIYTFLYDLYNGSNIDGDSLTMLINKHIPKDWTNIYIKNIQKILNKYINIKTLETIENSNEDVLKQIFNIHDSKLLMNSIKIPYQYFNTNIFDKYTILPKNANIVRIFK